MIYFQTKPDEVFRAILQEALLSEMQEIKLLADDSAIATWEGLYPETSRCFAPYTAVRMMAQLLAAERDAVLYGLTDSHWLLLYECLKNFCSTHNDLAEDLPDGLRAIGQYKISFLDDEAMVSIYFWDTDFLLEGAQDAWELDTSEEVCVEDQDGDNSWAHEEVPAFVMVQDVRWHIPEDEAFFRKSSTHYPDYGEE